MTAPAPTLPALAPVSAADAIDDFAWFAEHPGRRYRLRPGWAIRRRGRGTFLRTRLGDTRRYPDHERLAEKLWWRAADPTLSPVARHKLMTAARTNQSTNTKRSEAAGGPRQSS